MLSQLVVTNHSLLAIDAVEGVPMIPEYDAVVVDEAHELTARVTQAATDELSVPEVDRAARRAQRHVEGTEADDLADAGDALRAAFDECGPGRIDSLATSLADALVLVRDAARAVISAFPKESAEGEVDAGAHAGPGHGPGDLRDRGADGRELRRRRAVARRARAVPRRRPAVRRAAAGVGSPARQAAQRQDRGADQRDPDARRRLRRRRRVARLQAGGARGPLALGAAGDGGRVRGRRHAAVARHRRRVAVRLPPPVDPVRRPPPAPTGP